MISSHCEDMIRKILICKPRLINEYNPIKRIYHSFGDDSENLACCRRSTDGLINVPAVRILQELISAPDVSDIGESHTEIKWSQERTPFNHRDWFGQADSLGEIIGLGSLSPPHMGCEMICINNIVRAFFLSSWRNTRTGNTECLKWSPELNSPAFGRVLKV
jgi:hypothetical protein